LQDSGIGGDAEMLEEAVDVKPYLSAISIDGDFLFQKPSREEVIESILLSSTVKDFEV
jgi:hypothetical protein